MSIIIDGTNGISDLDGSASTPAIRGTDANTGIFFPAADTIAFAEGGAEVMRIDSSGNVGIGTSSPGARTEIYVSRTSSTNAVALILNDNVTGTQTNGVYKAIRSLSNNGASVSEIRFLETDGTNNNTGIAFATSPSASNLTERMRIDSSGRVGIGESSPVVNVHVKNTAGSAALRLQSTESSSNAQIDFVPGNQTNPYYIYVNPTRNLIFQDNATERARITSGGLFKVVNNGSTIENSTGGVNEINTAANDTNTVFRNTASSLTGARAGIDVVYTAAAPNGTTSNFYNASDTGAKRFEVRSNGGIGNYSANNVNLSDRREKINFAPAGEYLSKICAIPVQTFNYIDQNTEDDPGLTLGVVAQDVQEVAPELVMESNWGTQEEPKMRLSIYQTDFQYALMKSIQELKAITDAQATRIETLEAQNAAFEARLAALEAK